jgi:Na+-transporting NADH:ubiquinone oxidoreductase subunit C
VQFSTRYIFGFAATVCLVCSLIIAIPAVGLRERQDTNRLLDQQKSVLLAARIATPGDKLSAEKVKELFSQVQPKILDLESGTFVETDAATYDLSKVEKKKLPPNPAQIMEIPKQVKIYQVMKGEQVDMYVLPIYGKGLWSTLYGYIALDEDLNTIEGITYYQHGETPGLGGEVDNPRWKARWPGRKVFDEQGAVAIEVIKGAAGSVQEAPHEVDGLSGATLTARGVTNMLHFWMGEAGYGSYLKKLREQRSA